VRAKRTIITAAVVTAVLAWPGQAGADGGGAYLELDRTHYLPGDQGTAVTFVRIPQRRESILDQGPFYLYALVGRTNLEEGASIPMGAVRIGTFSIQAQERQTYKLTADFVVPRLEGDFYTLGVCNDPCTVSGFRDSLSGLISIVATRREAELLTKQSRLYDRVYQLRRHARKAERRLEAAQEDLEFQLANGEADREELTSRIDQLERSLAAAERRASDAIGPAFEPWVAGGILALAGAAAILAFRRRRLLAAAADLR
jgi:hypothetical protein